jgi:hypothetical protein
MDTPSSRYYAFIVMVTVGLMFTILLNIPPDFRSNNKLLIDIVGVVSSVGIYFTVSKILIFLLMRFNWVLKIFLGPYYVKGTWIGKVRTATSNTNEIKTNVFVEHYEQTLNSLVIRGYSFNQDGEEKADWFSTTNQIDADAGVLYCLFKTNIRKLVPQAEGLGHFQFDRKKKTTGPRYMSGYYVDTHKSEKGYYEDMEKICEKIIPKNEAKKKALKLLQKKGDCR